MYSIKEASEYLGVAASTLRRWEREGKLTSQKTTGGHRRYSPDILSKIKNPNRNVDKITIAYCRVSSSDQKADLVRQVENVSQFCIARGYSFKVT